MRDAGFFVEVQRVEIRAQTDRIRTGPATKHADDAGLRKPRVHLEPERAQLVGDEGGRGHLLERRFGLRVDVVAPSLHRGDEGDDLGDELHDGSGGRGAGECTMVAQPRRASATRPPAKRTLPVG
jgi:hypothetical protein